MEVMGSSGASKLRFLFLSYPEGFFAEFAIEAMAEILDLPRMVMFQFANCKRLPEAGAPLGKLPSVYLENGFWCDSDSESIDFFHYKKHGESVELTAHP